MNLFISLILLVLSGMTCLLTGYPIATAAISLFASLMLCTYIMVSKKTRKRLAISLFLISALLDLIYIVTSWVPTVWVQVILYLIMSLYFILKMKIASSVGKYVTRGLLILLVCLISGLLFIDISSNSIATTLNSSEKLPTVRIKKQKLENQKSLLADMNTMNSFGSRLTGSTGQNQFIDWLEKQARKMNLAVHENKYSFLNWTEKDSSLYVNKQKISISSVYPYSGKTGSKGISKELVYTDNNNLERAEGKIAVIQVDNTKTIPKQLIMNQQSSFPKGTHIASSDGDITLSAALKAANLKKAKKAGVKGVILVWKGASYLKVKGQYQPFTTDYAGVPALWVNESEGKKVIKAAKAHQKGKITLIATRKRVKTKSFYVTIPGKNKKESIIINTHTDGVNAIEENGAIALLAMIRYLKDQKPNKTLVFAFVTGHFRLPVFKGTSQATSTWLKDNPQVWDGKGKHLKAVAAITAEHLGSMEWKDNKDGKFRPTGKIQTEYTYVGNQTMNEIWMKAVKNRKLTRTVTLRGHNGFEFGESQPLFNEKIPVIGLIPMPDYLTTSSKNLEMDKFSVNLMHQQISSLLKATLTIDQLGSKQLGKGQSYSYFIGR
ncbi:hypothetical protein [Liquorilactobacillus mali]|uniref:hypothetical protein n=1 Tax=Liquorilactobacillus mali TaxID=1618 RepID=UPI00234FD4B5|nr:hypothetical protein [Liquorilactobacillus mali]MDC7952230.1 hypothetical protein [Liquorilactobacillus mali]